MMDIDKDVCHIFGNVDHKWKLVRIERHLRPIFYYVH